MNDEPTPHWEPKPLVYTERGFQKVDFSDRYGEECSLQQSSLAESEPPGTTAIWLGPGHDRMHLDRPMVEWLISMLDCWLATGRFDGGPPNE